MTTADNALLTAPTTRWWPGWLLPPATILVIVMSAVLLLMTPLWMHFAIGATGAGIPGLTPGQALSVSDQTVGELLLGPGTFVWRASPCPDSAPCAIALPIYTPDEASHLRDARGVLYAFVMLAAVSVAFIVLVARRSRHQLRFWQSLRRVGAALVVGTVVVGVIGFLAFDIGFELFHRIFFPGGNWSFDPDSNLIRLYPYAFWQLTALALGVMCVAAGAAVWLYARRRATRLEVRP